MRGQSGETIFWLPTKEGEMKKMINTSILARKLALTKPYIYNLCRAGKIPHYCIGRYYRFNEAEIDAWLEQKKAHLEGGEVAPITTLDWELAPKHQVNEESKDTEEEKPGPRPAHDEVMSRGEVAEELGLTIKEVSALIKNGDLPAWRPGNAGLWRVSKTGVRKWKEESR